MTTIVHYAVHPNPIEGRPVRLCGGSLGLFSADLAEVTCPACRDAIERISAAYRDARRVEAIPAREKARSPGRLLEELADDGRWKLFDLRGWCREPEGEYAVTLRVRPSERRGEHR